MLTSNAGHATAGAKVFRKQGDYWLIAYQGKSVRLPDTKGLRYLARLLRHPGREFHAMDLASDEARPETANVCVDDRKVRRVADAGEILDVRAITNYRRRLAELESEAAAAVSDAEEARLRMEIHFLSRELGSARGLGGRRRKSASSTERARKAVSNCIREAIDRTSSVHPELASHLSEAIRTGGFCSYEPRQPISWEN